MRELSYYVGSYLVYPRKEEHIVFAGLDSDVNKIWEKLECEITPEDRKTASRILKLESSVIKFKAKMKKYRDACDKLLREFKEDLIEDRGLSNNPKAETLYNLAREYARGEGLESIVLHFDKMSVLIVSD